MDLTTQSGGREPALALSASSSALRLAALLSASLTTTCASVRDLARIASTWTLATVRALALTLLIKGRVSISLVGTRRYTFPPTSKVAGCAIRRGERSSASIFPLLSAFVIPALLAINHARKASCRD